MAQLTPAIQARPGPAPARRGFGLRRCRECLAGLLAQGATPPRLAWAIAVAAGCGVFPFLGTTTLLTLGAGLLLRLNQPVMQAVNYLLSPVQLLLIPVFVRLGAWMLGADAGGFSVTAMLAAAHDGAAGKFLREFGRAGWYALVAWLALVPILCAVVWLGVAPLLRRMAAGRPREEGRS